LLGIEATIKMGKRNSLQWYGHVLRKVDDDWENKMCYFGGQGSQTEMQAQKKIEKGCTQGYE